VGKGDSPSEPGDVWVGLYGTRQLIRLDPYTGDTLATISVAGGANNMRPYGAAAGPDGKVWFVWAGWINSPGRNLLGYVDPATNVFMKAPDVPVNVANCARPYGMTLDPQGRIWIANTGCEPELIYYDPATATWDGVNVPGIKRQGDLGDENSEDCSPVTEDGQDYFECTSGNAMDVISKQQPVPRGMASSYKSIWFSVALRCPAGLTLDQILLACSFGVDPDGSCNGPGGPFDPDGPGCPLTAASACCTNTAPENLVGRVDLATKEVVKMTPLPTGRFPVGVGYSPNERVWVVGQNSDDVSYADLDENDERTSAWSTRTVGNTPYTYSDFIGFGLNELAAPDGYYRLPVTGCDGGFDTEWTSLSFDATTPQGTSVEFNVRTADSEVALEDALWVGPFLGTSPVDLTEAPGPVEDGRFMEVEIVLRTEQGTVKPKVRDLELGFTCTATNPG
jgi:DNA-binding beta-propeller fold protein YncE